MIHLERIIFTGLLLSGLLHKGHAQTHVVTGRVVDAASHSPLPFANVFIDRTTIGTAADGEGYFSLKGVPSGTTELLFSYVGYKLGKKAVRVSGEMDMDMGVIRLEVSEQQLSEVEVKASRDKAWEKQLRRFEKIFLGDDEMAEGCKILNPWVLDFGKDKGKSLTATAEVPLQIENNSLGYSVEFYLDDFWKDPQGYLIEGKARFIQMPPVDEATTLRWLQNREKAYIGSLQHFFKSIITNRIRGEKFYLYTERPGLERAATRPPLFAQAMKDALMHYDTLEMVDSEVMPGVFQVKLKGRVEVHNHNERALQWVYTDMGYKVSWVQLEDGVVFVSEEGFPFDPSRVVTSGDMSDQRVSYMLPTDYKKGKIEVAEPEAPSLARFRENVYVHTDKPYYYPGEPLWFKAYIKYADPILMDSMSKVLYVELIDPAKKVIASRTLLIEDGGAQGDFILGDTLRKGTYYLRAYTNWGRNFKDGLFVKPFALLDFTWKVDPTLGHYESRESDYIDISTDQEAYKPRAKITLKIKTTTAQGDAVPAKVSISVTDARQVVPVPEQGGLDFPEYSEGATARYPMEFGIGAKGRYLNDEGKPEQAVLNVFQFDPNGFYMAQADTSGIFEISGLQVSGRKNLYFKPDKMKKDVGGNDRLGSIEILPRDVPMPDGMDMEVQLKAEATEFPQRTISEYEVPKDARVLENVDIKSSRIDPKAERYAQSYGRPDYVLEAKQLNTNYGNLLYSLQGQFPGLVIREVKLPDDPVGSKWVIYSTRSVNTSILFPKPILLMVNNVAMAGDPAIALSTIDPKSVTRVELTNRVNSLHGARGAFGVLAIYTKELDEYEPEEVKQNFLVAVINGYDEPRRFTAPDYETLPVGNPIADYRSTIYWNPSLSTNEAGEAEVNFYAAALGTDYMVRCTAIFNDGTMASATHFIRIND